jgi:hypothetical protein
MVPPKDGFAQMLYTFFLDINYKGTWLGKQITFEPQNV